jgi:hypothetical protein
VEKISKPAPPVAKELTEEEMEKKTKAILDEYLHVQDIKVGAVSEDHSREVVRFYPAAQYFIVTIFFFRRPFCVLRS